MTEVEKLLKSVVRPEIDELCPAGWINEHILSKVDRALVLLRQKPKAATVKCKCFICRVEGEIGVTTDIICRPCYDKLKIALLKVSEANAELRKSLDAKDAESKNLQARYEILADLADKRGLAIQEAIDLMDEEPAKEILKQGLKGK